VRRTARLLVGAMALMSSLVGSAMAGAATMSSGSTAGAVSMAVVPTGRLGDPPNRFFQTFTSDGGGWRLTTPRGTATNGGIVVASPGAGAIAVLPFFASHVSALVSVSGGMPARDGRVISPLVANPTSLTVSPATGRLVAVTSTGEIQSARAVGSRLVRVATRRAVVASSAGRSCGLTAITAAATLPDGTLALGGRCSRPGSAGVLLAGVGGRWRSLAAPTPGPWTVLRVDPTEDGVVALVLSSARRPQLRSVHLTAAGAIWSRGQILEGSLRSTAVALAPGGRSSHLVAVAHRGRIQAWRLTPGGSVRRLGPSLGGRVQTIVDGPSGTLTAFSVDGRTVVPMALDAGTGRWVSQAPHVLPLAYGTSE